MKKMITFATVASLLVGSMSTTAYASVFADINTVPWPGAKTFIDQAASLGLINGYMEDGKKYCKPRNKVTYCETVQLMYSVMKVYTKQDVSDTTVTKWKPVISAYNIPAWAYDAVAYALENQILSATTDLEKLRNGTGYATREDVGVIFGKALDTVKGYDTKSNPTLKFRDAAKVSAAAKPYLDLLYRANLMVGDTNNDFFPQNTINRAEMSVLTVKAYQKMAATTPVEQEKEEKEETSGTMTGTVVNSILMANGDLFLSVKPTNGNGKNLFAKKGKVTPKYEGETITFNDIGEKDTVKLSYDGENITALEVTKSEKGIQKVVTYELEDLSDSKITVRDGSKEEEFRLLSDVTVELDSKKSSVSKLQNAMEDAKYDVTLTLNTDKRVTKIVAVKNSNNPTKGTLTDLDNSEITIKAGSKEYTYPLTDDDISIKMDGKTMTFSKLKSDYDDYNYTVSLKLDKKNEVTEISIEDYEDETKGTLKFLNHRRIIIESAGEEHTYYIDEDDVTVKIDGKSKKLDDLDEAFNEDEKAFTIELDDIDRDDYVGEIIATSKNSEESEGELVKVTSSEITIEVAGKEISHRFANDVDVKINGKSREISDLKDSYEDYEMDIELEFNSSSKVSKVEATITKVEKGELKDINEDDETIKVTAASVDVTLDLDDDVTIKLDGKTVSLSKLNDELDYADSDNKLTVELSYSGKKVSKITAEWDDEQPDEGTLVEVDTKKDEITIEVKNKEYTYDVDEDVYVSFSLASKIDEDDYDDLDDYDDTLSGLKSFFNDCDDNNDDCYVILTIDDDEVTRIKAKAE